MRLLAIERAFDDGGGVAVRDLVGEQILELTALVRVLCNRGTLHQRKTKLDPIVCWKRRSWAAANGAQEK